MMLLQLLAPANARFSTPMDLSKKEAKTPTASAFTNPQLRALSTDTFTPNPALRSGQVSISSPLKTPEALAKFTNLSRVQLKQLT